MKLETFTFEWSRELGDCIDCGHPAAFRDPNAYGIGKPAIYCAICAAYVASEGVTIERINPDM